MERWTGIHTEGPYIFSISPSVHLSPCSSPCSNHFPIDRRGVGQKFGTEGQQGLLAPCHNPGMNHINLTLKGTFRCVIDKYILINVIICDLKRQLITI